MSYFIHHHPHVFAELLTKLHELRQFHVPHYQRHTHALDTAAIPLTITQRRLNRLLFWFRGVSLSKKLVALSVLTVVPAAVMTGMFMTPESVSFSFAGDTCFSNPSLFPGVNTKFQSDTFEIEQRPSASFGSTPLFSNTTCVDMRAQPEKNVAETLQIKTPLGISKVVEVSVDTIPELLSSQHIDPNISQKDAMTFQLNTADTNFSYVLFITDTAIDCVVNGTEITCPISQLELEQGQSYPYSLRRYFGDSYVVLYAEIAQTAEPLTIAPGNIQPDQTVFTHVSEITLTTNKPATQLGTVMLTQGETLIPTTVAVEDTTIIIKAAENLPRATSFTATATDFGAEDGGFLQAPFTFNFATSGGPRVSTISIAKTGVPVYSDITISMNIGLQSGQNADSLASVTIGGQQISASVSYSGNKILINPSGNLPKCSDFTVHVAADSISVHGIGNGAAWSYSARTACYDTFSIGSSVNGRSIIGYKFGSGGSTVVFVGGLHGTERSSKRTLDAWIDELDANFGRIPTDKTIVVIPNSNPDGYARGSRTNARNVDLNRNFPSNDWTKDVYQPGNVLLENGGGLNPLSEPESANLASYIQSVSPSLVLTYHAVARTVIYNGSGNSASLASMYGNHTGFGVSSSSHEDGIFAYPTTGEFETWLHDKLGIPTLLIENATQNSNEFNTHRNAMWAVIGG